MLFALLFAQRRPLILPRAVPRSDIDWGLIVAVFVIVLVVLFAAGFLWRFLRTANWSLDSGGRRPRWRKPRGTLFPEQRAERPRRPSYRPAPVLERDDVEPKARATHDLLTIVGRHDAWFAPTYLKEVADNAFVVFQKCWASRAFERLGTCLTRECQERFLDRYDDPEKRGVLPRWHEADLERLQIVRFSAGAAIQKHAFTVLVTARGDDRWQEFWTFRRFPDGWKLARIQSANAIEALTDP